MATAGVWARIMMEESICVPGKTGLFGSMRLGFIVLRRVSAEQAEVLGAWSAQRGVLAARDVLGSVGGVEVSAKLQQNMHRALENTDRFTGD